MTKALREIFEAASKLPDEAQDALAAIIAEELRSEQRWQSLLDDPRSSDLLKDLADEALQEYRRGETRVLDPRSYRL